MPLPPGIFAAASRSFGAAPANVCSLRLSGPAADITRPPLMTQSGHPRLSLPTIFLTHSITAATLASSSWSA